MMSLNNQSDTIKDDFEIDTPEKRLLMQSLAQKLFHRVCEINLNTDHVVHFVASSNSYSKEPSLTFHLYWYVDGNISQQRKPATQDQECHYWLSSQQIEKWFLDANIGLDLLIAETEAA